jgi:hypothetical protein
MGRIAKVPRMANEAIGRGTSVCVRTGYSGLPQGSAEEPENREWRAHTVRRLAILASCATLVFFFLAAARPAEGQSGLQRVNHIIVVMQENHSFDNYFGALAYAPGSPYHRASSFDRDGDRDPLDLDQDGCREGDHRCVVANDDRPAPSPGAIQVIIRERFLALPRSVSN